MESITERLGLDEVEYKEIVDLFIETTISDLAELTRAIHERNPSMAIRSSHSIKGASANLGLEEICAAAAELEKKARLGQLEDARETTDLIRQYLDGLKGI